MRKTNEHDNLNINTKQTNKCADVDSIHKYLVRTANFQCINQESLVKKINNMVLNEKLRNNIKP